MHVRRDGHCSGRYTSYWNVFLFRLILWGLYGDAFHTVLTICGGYVIAIAFTTDLQFKSTHTSEYQLYKGNKIIFPVPARLSLVGLSVADPEFPRRVAPTNEFGVKTYYFTIFLSKTA